MTNESAVSVDDKSEMIAAERDRIAEWSALKDVYRNMARSKCRGERRRLLAAQRSAIMLDELLEKVIAAYSRLVDAVELDIVDPE